MITHVCHTAKNMIILIIAIDFWLLNYTFYLMQYANNAWNNRSLLFSHYRTSSHEVLTANDLIYPNKDNKGSSCDFG